MSVSSQTIMFTAGQEIVVIDELIPRAAENLADTYGLSRVRYTYVDDGAHRRISVFWDYGEESE